MKKVLKNNGGYVLIYVLVVFALLSALAGTVSGVALKNLRAQEAAITRMGHLYAAEGEIEKLVAEAQNQTSSEGFKNCIGADDPINTNTYRVNYTASNGGVTVTATVDFTVKVETDPTSGDETSFDVTEVEYVTYDISG